MPCAKVIITYVMTGVESMDESSPVDLPTARLSLVDLGVDRNVIPDLLPFDVQTQTVTIPKDVFEMVSSHVFKRLPLKRLFMTSKEPNFLSEIIFRKDSVVSLSWIRSVISGSPEIFASLDEKVLFDLMVYELSQEKTANGTALLASLNRRIIELVIEDPSRLPRLIMSIMTSLENKVKAEVEEGNECVQLRQAISSLFYHLTNYHVLEFDSALVIPGWLDQAKNAVNTESSGSDPYEFRPVDIVQILIAIEMEDNVLDCTFRAFFAVGMHEFDMKVAWSCLEQVMLRSLNTKNLKLAEV